MEDVLFATRRSMCGLCILELTTGRKGLLLWPPRLLDHTPENVYLLAYMKRTIYSKNAGRPLEFH
jgi:hypothetical protein